MEKRTKLVTIINWRPGYIDLSNSNFTATIAHEKRNRRIYKVTFKLDPTIKFVVVVSSKDSSAPSLPSPDECVMIQAYKKVEEQDEEVKVRPVVQIITGGVKPKVPPVFVKPLIIDKRQKHEIVAHEIIYYWVGIEYDVALAARYKDWPYVRYV